MPPRMLLRSQSDQIAKATHRCFSKYFPNHRCERPRHQQAIMHRCRANCEHQAFAITDYQRVDLTTGQMISRSLPKCRRSPAALSAGDLATVKDGCPTGKTAMADAGFLLVASRYPCACDRTYRSPSWKSCALSTQRKSRFARPPRHQTSGIAHRPQSSGCQQL